MSRGKPQEVQSSPGEGLTNNRSGDGQAMPSRGEMETFCILMALYLSMFVTILGQTAVPTAITTITSELHSASGYTWIGGAFLLAKSVAMPICAKLLDFWGRKSIILASLALFFIASIVCAMASSMAVLIVGRTMQGAGGGGILQSVIIINTDMDSLRRRSLNLGLGQVVWAVSGGVGPLLGGLLAETSWRWIFWLNLPIVGLAMSLLIASSAISALSEKRAATPLVPLKLFAQRANAAAFIVAAIHGFVLTGTEYYLPQYFHSVRAMSPLRSGLFMTPLAISSAMATTLTSAIIQRTGERRQMLQGGMALTTLGTALFVLLGTETSTSAIVSLGVLGAAGIGVCSQLPEIAVQAAAAPRERDVATAMATLGFLRNVAAALSVVVGGAVVQNEMASRGPDMLDAALAARLAETEAVANVDLVWVLTQGQERAAREMFALGLRKVWVLYVCVAAVSTVFVKRIALSQEHAKTKTGLI